MPQVKATPSIKNCCCVLNQYFSLALSLSLNSWLTKLWVLFVICEGNLCLGPIPVGWAHTVSRVSQEPWMGHGQATAIWKWDVGMHLIYCYPYILLLFVYFLVLPSLLNFSICLVAFYTTVEPLYKYTSEMKTSPLIRTPSMVPATYRRSGYFHR